MKFDELYKRVYLNEQDKEVSAEEAPEEIGNETTEANPEDFKGDVEPMPQPALPEPATAEGQSEVSQGTTLMDYVNKLDEVSELLLNLDGDCLQKLVLSLDKPGTPFDGISNKSAEIVRTSEALSTLSGKLKMYIISSAKG
jgi:hypothetical protein